MLSRIERRFVAIREGQVHCRVCGDPNLPPLVMFHASPGSSLSLTPLMSGLAKARHVIAIDTLGNGDSAAPSLDEPDIAYFADAHVRAIDALGLENIDLYGTHTGAAICAEVAINQPNRVKKIVMDGVSLFDAKMRHTLRENNHAPEIRPDYAGSQLLAAWTMIKDAHMFWPWWNRVSERRRNKGLPTADYLHDEVVELLKACRTYHKSYRAALAHPRQQRLPLVRNRTLIACAPADPLLRYLDEVVAIMPNARSAVTAGEDSAKELADTADLMIEFLNSD